jgi:CRP-like cAMP-binding protein
MKIVEFGKTIEPGTVLGEIGVFARNQNRMATIICCSDCEVYELRDKQSEAALLPGSVLWSCRAAAYHFALP